MFRPTVFGFALGLTAVAGTVQAAPDLATPIQAPSSTQVYSTASYQVQVVNTGRHTANNTKLPIQLPSTHTSPQVYVLGDLGSFSNKCQQAGTVLNCSLGNIRKNKSVSINFAIALPQSSTPVNISATASTSGETSLGNNTATHVPALTNPNQPITPLAPITTQSCTGTTLQSFFECELFPSSIMGYAGALDYNGNVVLPPYATGYSASWSQPGGDSRRLEIKYYELGNLSATFDGYAVGNNCFEGLTTFPGNSPYVSQYQVCL